MKTIFGSLMTLMFLLLSLSWTEAASDVSASNFSGSSPESYSIRAESDDGRIYALPQASLDSGTSDKLRERRRMSRPEPNYCFINAPHIAALAVVMAVKFYEFFCVQPDESFVRVDVSSFFDSGFALKSRSQILLI